MLLADQDVRLVDVGLQLRKVMDAVLVLEVGIVV